MNHAPECLSHIGCPCNCVESQTIERAEKVDAIVEAMTVVLSTPIDPVCLSCNAAFQTDQIKITTSYGPVCIDCGLCISCGDQVTITEIEFCTKHNTPIQHSRCRMKTNPIKIPVSEYELGILNNCRLLIVPDVNVSVETNVNTARLAHGQMWETMTLEQKFIHTQMLEAVYSAAYMALKKDPTEVKQKLRERDMKRTEEAHEQARKDRQTQLPSERRKIGLQEKFWKGMESSGVTKEQAKAIWVSQGRVWVE